VSPIEPASLALARTITALRRRRSLTQEDVAIAAGITPGTLSRIEGGKANPTWTTVERIAAALSVSVTELAAAAEREG
jgi:transcriptional regulator with XRE-family HTH domain